MHRIANAIAYGATIIAFAMLENAGTRIGFLWVFVGAWAIHHAMSKERS